MFLLVATGIQSMWGMSLDIAFTFTLLAAVTLRWLDIAHVRNRNHMGQSFSSSSQQHVDFGSTGSIWLRTGANVEWRGSWP